MHVRDPEPDVRPSQVDRYKSYLTSTSSQHLHLSIAVILTILHFTPVIIKNPQNPNTIIFAQPYITKWLMVPYALYYTCRSGSQTTGRKPDEPLLPQVRSISATSDDLLLITEPRTIIRNLRVGLLTYMLCGAMMVWDVSYAWGTYILLPLWNSLPPYAVGQWSLELLYLGAAGLLLLTLILGPLWVPMGIWVYGLEVWEDSKTVESLCVEKLKLKQGERKGSKET